MKQIHGKMVYTSFEEVVDPAHTAVIVIDMQNDFSRPEGSWPSRLGVDISMIAGAVPRIRRFLDAARSSGCLIIHTQHTALPDMRSDGAPRMRARMPGGPWPDEFEYTIEGSWGQQFVDELQPAPGEIVVKKHRSSSFFDTNLGVVLRGSQIDSVVIAGCITDGCVISTYLHASWLDYYVTVVSDCVATWNLDRHETALAMMPTRTSDDLIAAWGLGAAAAAE